MALTFTPKVNTRLGRKRMTVYEVKHDGSTTAINAADIGLNYVDYALATAGTIAVSAGTTALPDLTTNSGTALAMTALSADSLISILAIGT